MLRSLIDCSRLMLESPWLMLLGFVIVALPGGLLLMPVLASKLRRAKKHTSSGACTLVQPATGSPDSLPTDAAKSELKFIPFLPSVRKVQ